MHAGRMNRLILTCLVGSLSGSSIDRLRYFHQKLVDCLGVDCPDAEVNAETRAALVSSGLRFARNEGRELDAFIDALKTAAGGGVGPANLDDMRWSIVECLFSDCDEEQKSIVPQSNILGDLLARVAAEGEEVDEVLDKAPVEPPRRTEDSGPARKRMRSSSEETMKRELKTLCNEPIDLSGYVNVGLRFLARQHVAMVGSGDWEALEKRFEVLSKAGAGNLAELFCDAHRVSMGQSPVLKISRDDERLILNNWLTRSWSRDEFMKQLCFYVDSAGSKKMSSEQKVLAEELLNLTKSGGWEAVIETFNLLRTALVAPMDIGMVFGPVQHYLLKH